MIRLYTRVLQLLGKEDAPGLDPGGRQPAAGRRAIRRAGAVRPDHRRALGQSLDGAMQTRQHSPWPLLAAWVAFGLFTIVCSARGRAPCRPARAPPAPGGADRLFRAHHAVAADLPHRHPFRPPDEGDAERHRCAVAALARLLPRAFRRDRLAGRAAAAVALSSTGGWPSCS